MKFKYIIVFLLVSLNLFSQIKLSENEFEALKLKAKIQVKNDIDSSFYYCNLMEESENKLHKAFAKSYRAYCYQLKNDTILSNKNIENAINLIEFEKPSLKKYKTESQILNLSGLIDKNRGKYSDAINKYEKGKKIAKKINDQKLLIKLNNNIASVNGEIGNFHYAINSLKENNDLIDKYKYTYSKADYFKSKSLINYNIANFYQDAFLKENISKYIDSAEFYLNNSLLYSNSLSLNKLRVNIDLANIKFYKKKYLDAEKYYNTAGVIAKENKFINEQIIVKYNLGQLNYSLKKNEKALILFKEVDSICYTNKLFGVEFMKSNYYQGKIYYDLNDKNNGLKHFNIFTREYNRIEKNIIDQSLKINHQTSSKDLMVEVEKLKNELEKKIYFSNFWKLLVFIFVLGLIFFLIKITKEKKKSNKRVEQLLEEFKNKKESKNTIDLNTKLNINNEKEKKILENLESLIQKKYFLSQDFNQQNVAQKIKTNTTYLSHIVNKNFNKSFSEYSNELKINYAIEELINNPTYRKYSTQAIAESVGYKSNSSFTKSFKKRAGVSPAQFILKIEKTN